MAQDKLYPKHELLQIYSQPVDTDDRLVGRFKYKIIEKGQLPMFASTAEVYASTQAFYCEQLRLVLVINQIAVSPPAAIAALPKDHPLRANREKSSTINYVYRSDFVARDIIRIANDWGTSVEFWLPSEIMCEPDPRESVLPAGVDAVEISALGRTVTLTAEQFEQAANGVFK